MILASGAEIIRKDDDNRGPFGRWLEQISPSETPLKKIIFTFGALCGFIAIALMLTSMSLEAKVSCGSTSSMVIGYTILAASALFIFFGIKSYCDNVATGPVSFGKAFQVGLLISLVASVCYVVGWEFFDHFVKHQSMDGYFNALQQKAIASHLSPEKLQEKLAEIQRDRERYQHLLWNAAYTFLEPFPVLVLMSLISAGILRRRSTPSDSQPATTVTA